MDEALPGRRVALALLLASCTAAEAAPDYVELHGTRGHSSGHVEDWNQSGRQKSLGATLGWSLNGPPPTVLTRPAPPSPADVESLKVQVAALQGQLQASQEALTHQEESHGTFDASDYGIGGTSLAGLATMYMLMRRRGAAPAPTPE